MNLGSNGCCIQRKCKIVISSKMKACSFVPYIWAACFVRFTSSDKSHVIDSVFRFLWNSKTGGLEVCNSFPGNSIMEWNKRSCHVKYPWLHCIKIAYVGKWRWASQILNVGIKWKWVVSFALGPESHRYVSRCGLGERRTVPRSSNPLAATIPTELYYSY
jgi:hypothetical protein